jgi:threonine/homoserine/homoserine lactone efflux protein
MFGIHNLGLYVVSGLLLNLAPGADFLYVLTRSASRGFVAGVWAGLGIGAGCFVHIGAAALGLSAILASSAMAFSVVKWLGAGYLVYLGISMLLSRGSLQLDVAGAPANTALVNTDRHSRIFWQGFLTNVLNPKVALFFLAFVPQFIDPASPTKVEAFLLLGAIFNTTGTIWNIVVARASSFLAARLRAASKLGVWLNRCLGGLFIALGVRLAASHRT